MRRAKRSAAAPFLVASAAAKEGEQMDLLQNLVFLREKGEEPHLHCGQTKYNQQNGSVYLTNKRVLWVPAGKASPLYLCEADVR